MSLVTPTVVITGSGTVTCQSVIKALRSQDELPVHIVTVDMFDNVAGRYFSDDFHTVPAAGHPDFVDAVLDVCRLHGASLLIPIVDYEFMPISLNANRFGEIGCLAAVSPPEVIQRVNDKLKTYDFFRHHGYGTATTWDAQAAEAAAGSLPYPVFLKPAVDGRSSLDCYVVESREDLDVYLRQVPNAMVQELVRAPEFTADVLADWNSEVLGIVVRERLETKGGVSYKGRTAADPVLEEQVIALVRDLGLLGPANIQAFRTDSDVLFNEINPRFSGALALSLAAGLNSPLMLLKLALGLPVESRIGHTRVGLTMLRYWDEVFVDASGKPEFPEYHLSDSIKAGVLA